MRMSPDPRALALLEKAWDLPPEGRRPWLQQACAGDAALFEEVDGLLAAAHATGGILDQSVDALSLGLLAGDEEPPDARAHPDGDPARIGRYRIVRRLGQGGMGIVFEAIDERLDRRVALKILSGSATSNPATRDRLLTEARAAAAIEHRNICAVYDVGEADGRMYIAMAFCEGEPLSRSIARGPLPVNDAVRIAAQVADALAPAHAAGIVHRDVKPSNLMLDASGDVKLVDFGLAKRGSATSTLTRDGVRLGTPAYMSPEQARGEPIDARTDLWSLGAVLYEMLTGQRAFPQEGELALLRSIIDQEPIPPRRIRAEIPEGLEAIVRRALQKDPRDRYSAASEMLEDLEAIRAGRSARIAALPAASTKLLGREQEIEDVLALLASARLITLTGPGGTGKTRLSIEVAARASPAFSDGVCFVPLAAVDDPALIPSTIALALGLRESPAHATVAGLAGAIGGRNLLLVLDDFERIAAGAPLIADLLARCARVKVLVTSRVVLRVSGEHAFPVPPLAVSVPEDGSHSESPAVALFLDRARAIRPDLAVDEEGMRAVIEICRRLEGMPLSIELAAARSRVFPPSAILARLESRLDLLREGPRDRPARHQTLRSALAWSYDLLAPEEQSFFRSIAVFVEGCPLEGAVEVAGGGAEDDAVDRLAALVDHSLLAAEAAASPRFRMLETIREYALERLQEAGEADRVRAAHAAFFQRMAVEAEAALTGREQGAWIRRLDAEHANLRAAQAWAEERRIAGAALAIGRGLWRYYLARGLLREGRARLEAALAIEPAGRSTARAKVLNGAATLAHNEGDNAAAHALLAEALEIFRENGDEQGIVEVLNNLSWVACEMTMLEEAHGLAAEALERNRTGRDARGVALSLNNLGWVALYRGNLDEAEARLRESLGIRRDLGDRRGVAFAAANVAWCRIHRGELEEAERLLEEAEAELRGLDDPLLGGLVGVHRGRIALDRGDARRACEILEEDMRLWRISGNRSGIAWSLMMHGEALRVLGRAREAEDCIAESLDVWKAIGGTWGSGYALTVWASLAAGAGDAAAAARRFREALDLRRRIGDRVGVAETCEAMCLADVESEADAGELARMLLLALRIRERIGAPVAARFRRALEARSAAILGRIDEPMRRAIEAGVLRDLEESAG